MSNEKKKEWLNRYRYYKKREQFAEEEIKRIREAKEHPSVIMDDMPHGHNQADLSSYMVQLERAEKKWLGEVGNAERVRAEILQAIEELESDMHEIMILRYLQLVKWEKICVLTDYSWAQAHRIHAKALKEIKTGGKKE